MCSRLSQIRGGKGTREYGRENVRENVGENFGENLGEFCWSRFDTYHHAFKFSTHIYTHCLAHKFCIKLLPLGLQRWGLNSNKIIAKHVVQ